jgi:glycine cleavage system P protein (glycine dehydrogenase)
LFSIFDFFLWVFRFILLKMLTSGLVRQRLLFKGKRTRFFFNGNKVASSTSSVLSRSLSSSAASWRRQNTHSFVDRHLGVGVESADRTSMLQTIGVKDMRDLMASVVPENVWGHKVDGPKGLTCYDIGAAQSEASALEELAKVMALNVVKRSMIGQGYYDTLLPSVIRRNVLENPEFYTAYTPYQPEVSQGRLEALMNFQVVVAELTGFGVAGASLLDEGTAAAEAMSMCLAEFERKNRTLGGAGRRVFFVDENAHPQTIDVVRGRAEPRDIDVAVGNLERDFDEAVAGGAVFGALVHYPGSDGTVLPADRLRAIAERVRSAGALSVCATDLLALTVLTPPGELGFDVAVGSAQRFGVPMGYGGPHAGFIATRDTFVRQLPGRIIGVSVDVHGNEAYRMALQTREQHIRREKATSNICTAQALLANIAAFYAIYHGPDGLRGIAERTHRAALRFAAGVGGATGALFFDTVRVDFASSADVDALMARAAERGYNLRRLSPRSVCVAFDERSADGEADDLLTNVFVSAASPASRVASLLDEPSLVRAPDSFLQHDSFFRYRSEAEMTRYLFRLAQKDVALTRSMISLGSCTMKLNATSEMIPVTWENTAQLHPFAPADQVRGYRVMLAETEHMLATLTGFTATSLQPNAGSQGELAGLLVIRRYLDARQEDGASASDGDGGQRRRRVCLIPRSAHGTNPASAVLAGFDVKVVKCVSDGSVDLDDLRAQAAKCSDELAALMITYPSTHGVFEEEITEICDVVHEHGGQVYMDGANMNAQCGITSPGDLGADVCHLNLHKTFCIPHGGGGPGVGPICVAKHLAPYLPGHSVVTDIGGGAATAISAVSAAPYGSASIVPISYMYLKMMGSDGIRMATETAILNANYMRARLQNEFRVLYTGDTGFVAHEFIVDLNPFKSSAGIVAEDVAKRLIDFGFHAPTMSFPVPGTLMIEPTESESKGELDRFCDAMLQIRSEIRDIEEGRIEAKQSPLKFAPHTAGDIASDSWDRAYSREQAVYPLPWVRHAKYWPPVGRIDNVYGDKHLNVNSCPCEPISSFEQ